MSTGPANPQNVSSAMRRLQASTTPQLQPRRHRPAVVGTARNAGGLAGAPPRDRNFDLFVGGCSLASTEAEIRDHCLQKGVTVDNILSLETRAPWYKAFKITLAAEDRDKLLDPELWPVGVFVRKFFRAKHSQSL